MMTSDFRSSNKVLSLSPEAIIDLSCDTLDWDDSESENSIYDSESDVSDDYTFDCNSSLTNDLDVSLFDPASFSGAFRWTDLTKFSDENPELVRRKKFLIDQKRKSALSKYRQEVDVVIVDVTPDIAECCSLLTNNTHNNDTHNDKCSTKMGERISLLLNSPITKSPRSAMTGYWNNKQVVDRNTLLKSGPTKTTTKKQQSKITDIIDDVLSMDDTIYTLQDETEFMCIAMMKNMNVEESV